MHPSCQASTLPPLHPAISSHQRKSWETQRVMQGPELAFTEHLRCQGLCEAVYEHDLTESSLLLSDVASKVTPILHKWELSFQEVKAPAQAYLGQYGEPGLGSQVLTVDQDVSETLSPWLRRWPCSHRDLRMGRLCLSQ